MHLLQCFSCFAASALESDCKDTKLFPTGKIIHDNSRPFAVIHVEKRPRIGRIQRIFRAIRAIRVQKKRWCGYLCLTSLIHRPSKGLQKALGIPPDGSHWNPGAATLGMPVAFRINMYPHHSPSVPAPTVHRLFNGFLSEGGRRGFGPGSDGWQRKSPPGGGLGLLTGACYFLSHWSNQSMKLRCQRRLFWGLSTQWVSSGK